MYKKAWQSILEAKSILLISHIRPDGDTLGCVLALYSVLKGLKKDVKLYNPSKNIPRRLSFLPNTKDINCELPIERFDVAVACDCGALDRTRIEKRDFTLINIDHHESNNSYGDINIIKTNAPSATTVVYKLLRKNDIVITQEVALCLYVGFMEDTGYLAYGNIDKSALKMLIHFVKCGLNFEEVNGKLRQEIPLSQARLRQHIYDVFYLCEKATVGVAIISQKDLQRIGCNEDDTKNIINLVRELVTVRLAIMVVEQEFGGCKISLRSKGDLNVNLLANAFGGGGHKKAAGFEEEVFAPEKTIEKIINKKREIENGI